MTCYFRGFFDTLIAATGSYRKLDSLRDAPPPVGGPPSPEGKVGGRLTGNFHCNCVLFLLE